MRVVIFGGAGFVGLNVAEQLLARGDDVVVFDRAEPPKAAVQAFANASGKLDRVQEDVTDAAAVRSAVEGADAVVYGAAITSGPEREAADPRSVMDVNLVGFLTALEAARGAGVKRVLNLSSAGAYGDAAFGTSPLDEGAVSPDPRSLYALTKFASERVGMRMGELWEVDVRSFRLSTVFGPWERGTGVRDTLSPPFQVMRGVLRGEPVVLERHDVRDWLYAPDVGRAVAALLRHPNPAYDLYNVGPGVTWDLVAWTERLRAAFPDLVVSVDPTRATIASHAPRSRQPLAVERLRTDLGLAPFAGLEASADAYVTWAQSHATFLTG